MSRFAAEVKLKVESRLHFSKGPQTRLCFAGVSTSLTLDPSKVTCKNCLSLLKLSVKKKIYGDVDWNAIYVEISDKKLPLLKRSLKAFLFEHPKYEARCEIGNYPPHIWLRFWLPSSGDKRRKTVAFNRNDDWMRGDIVQTLIPQTEDLDAIATFVGQQAEELELVARRTDKESAGLSYEFKKRFKK